MRKQIKKFVGMQMLGITLTFAIGTMNVFAGGNHDDSELVIDGAFPWTEGKNIIPRTKENLSPIYIKVEHTANDGQQIYAKDELGKLVTGVALAHEGQEYFFKFKKVKSMSVRPYSLFEDNAGGLTGLWSPDSIHAHDVIK